MLIRKLLFCLAHVGLLVVSACVPQEERLLDTLPGPTAHSCPNAVNDFAPFTNAVCDVIFSPNGKMVASVNANTVRLWNVAQRKNVLTLIADVSLCDFLSCVAFDPEGRTVAAGVLATDESLDGMIQFWKLEDRTTSKLGEGTGPVRSIAYIPDGKRIVAGKGDGTVKVWDVTNGKNTATLRGHTRYVTSVAVSPDGKYIASGSADSTIRLWEIATGRCLTTFNGHIDGVFSVAFSPDGKRVASGGVDKTIKLWDVRTGNVVTLKGHVKCVYAVAFSPDGKILASGSGDNTVRLWDVATGKNTHTLKGHTDSVQSVAFSPDGKILASGSRDTTIKLWNVCVLGQRVGKGDTHNRR